MAETKERYWETKPLEALSPKEWESLCDGCGRCCLVKLEDDDTGTIHYTDVVCRLFDQNSCRCGDYRQRRRKVRDCLKLTPQMVRALAWLPPSCAYRLRQEGRPLFWWHPLISGTPETVHTAGISVRGRIAASETAVALDDYPEHIVKWPARIPARAKPAAKRAPAPPKLPRRR